MAKITISNLSKTKKENVPVLLELLPDELEKVVGGGYWRDGIWYESKYHDPRYL